MNNKILASVMLGITACLSLTACTSGGNPETLSEDNSDRGTFASVACEVVDAATILSISSCEKDESSAASPVAEGSDLQPSEEQPSGDPSVADQTAEAEASISPSGNIGQQVVNRGVTLKVLKAEEVDSIEMNRTGFTEEKDIIYTKDKPGNGGKFLKIDTLIKNTGDKSMDLTCGWPIENKVLDSDKRAFDPIDELYMLKGNPECNVNLQPGFDAKMSYVYNMPDGAIPEAFAFRDASDESGSVFTNVSLK